MGLIQQDVGDYIKALAREQKAVVFCEGYESRPQRGQTCKLIAGANVQNYLYQTQAHSQPALPVCKQGVYPESLRRKAKAITGSQVGEMYGAGQMRSVLNYNDFETHSYCLTDQQDYQHFLISCLDQKQPVIAYFDVCAVQHRGRPANFQGEFEHSAVIVGYYFDKQQLRLIAAQWGCFFDMSCQALMDSSAQLKTVKPAEHFQKYRFFGNALWLERDQIARSLNQFNPVLKLILSWLQYLWPKNDEIRVSAPPTNDSGCLASVLTVIHGDQRDLDLDAFSNYRLPVTVEPDVPQQGANP